MANRPIRIGIVGGQRGRSFTHALAVLADNVSLEAVCDINDAVIKQWRESHPSIKGFTRFDDLLAWDGVDAVVIATPIKLHADMAIRTLQAKKHVLCEVPAATSLDECWALIEAVKTSGMTYMLAENYCYTRPNMMVLNMVEQGLFGDLVYAEGAYIHDCRNLLFNADGSLTWRGVRKTEEIGNVYPTHSLGPIAQWFGINRPDGDKLLTVAAFSSEVRSLPKYAGERFGAGHPGAHTKAWKQGDTTICVIQTEKGALINLRYDTVSTRPHNMHHYVLQGTKGAYQAGRQPADDLLIYLDESSPAVNAKKWSSLWSDSDQYEHAYWRQWGEAAKSYGHGGGDFFILRDFVNAIITGTTPPIDVYDAVTWSSIIPLSAQSLEKGGTPVEVPDFTCRLKRG